MRRGAGAAGAADLDRGAALGSGRALQFGDVQRVVDDYLARDPGRDAVRIRASLSAHARTLQLTCSESTPIAFGAMFGKGAACATWPPRLRGHRWPETAAGGGTR